MQVRYPPSLGPTPEVGLGFDFDFSAVGDFFKQAAPLATQIYAQKANIDMQKRLAEAQAKQAMAARMATMQQPQSYYGGQPVYSMTQGRGAGVFDGGSNLPPWVVPAAIAGGVGLLALVMLRR